MANRIFISGILSMFLSFGNTKKTCSDYISPCLESKPLTRSLGTVDSLGLATIGSRGGGRTFLHCFDPKPSCTSLCFSLPDCQLKQASKCKINNYSLTICELFSTANSFMILYSTIWQLNYYMLYISGWGCLSEQESGWMSFLFMTQMKEKSAMFWRMFGSTIYS